MLDIQCSPVPVFETERLILRRPNLSDAPALLGLRSNEQIMQHIGRPRFKTLEEAEELILNLNENIDNNTGISWAITLKEDPDTMIGHIGYWRINKEHYRGEIGYLLHNDHWKKGIMTEAFQPVLDYGFHVLKFHGIEGHTSSENIGSQATMRKAGFRQEALFREHFFFDGKFSDTVVLCLLVSDRSV